MSDALNWTPDRLADLAGRTVLITGAGRGIGLETTIALLGAGARVLAGVRDTARATGAIARRVTPDQLGRLDARQLDLADLESVRRFTDGVAADRLPVESLVNNAGINSRERRLSPQGFESTIATNHLGPFALTGRLLALLEAADDPRVVTVTSFMHRRGRLHSEPADLLATGRYSGLRIYADSKQANVLFGLELERRLRTAGARTRSFLVHPGMSGTDMQRDTAPRVLVDTIGRLLSRPAAEGAWPTLFAATDPLAPTDRIIGVGTLRADRRLHLDPPHPAAADPAPAGRLWQLSERVTEVRYALPAPAAGH